MLAVTVRRVGTVINVCFAGITGWAAQPIVEAIGRTDDLVLTSGVSRSAAGQSLVEVTGKNWTGSVFATVAEALASAPTDVLVDFTGATAVKVNVWTAVEAEVHVVIGSSGLTRLRATQTSIDCPATGGSGSSLRATSRSWPPCCAGPP